MEGRCNILFIMADQFRHDALTHVGGTGRTEALDALAAEGVSFRCAATNSPECIPARFALATGLYPHQTGVWRNAPFTLSPTAWTWMRALAEAGYRTSLFGKTHFHESTHASADLRDGLDLMREYGLLDVDEIAGPRASTRIKCAMTDVWEQVGVADKYRTDFAERFAGDAWTARPSPLGLDHYYDTYVGRRALEYLSSYDRPEPWFCWVSFAGPHEPWDAPAPYDRMHPAASMLPAIPRMNEWEAAKGLLHDLFRAPAHAAPPSQSDIAALRANYAGNVTLIDDQIGAIVDCLKSTSIYAKTLIVFTSDHGEMNGDQGLLYKSNFLSSAVDIPLIVRPPGCRREKRSAPSEALIELIDVGATLLDYAGTSSAPSSNGRSLRPLLEGSRMGHRGYVVSEFAEHTMVATASMKCEFNSEGEPVLLFDRIADPLEQRNVVDDPAFDESIAALRAKFIAHRAATAKAQKITV